MAGSQQQRAIVETPPLPEWLRNSIDAFPSPVSEQMLGYASTAWDEGFKRGIEEARKRRRGAGGTGSGSGDPMLGDGP